jgi:cation diffusion facilitator family transporter
MPKLCGMAGASKKAILTALIANVGIGVAKFIGAAVSGSASMLAEGIHSVVDCSNQGLLLFGKRAARKPPDEDHPLGYGREHFFWSFIVAILLFSLGGLFSIREGLHKFHDAEPLDIPWLGLIIFAIGIAFEGYALKTCLREVHAQNRFGSLRKWFKETTSSDLLVLFTEDAAAMLGLAIAALFLSIAWVTGNPTWDAVGSILVGCLLVGVAFILGVEVKSLLIGESSSLDYTPALREIISEFIPQGVLLKLITLQLGNDEVLVSYKVSRGTVQSAQELIDAINKIERRMKEKFPEIRWQFVEPDDHA